MDLISVTIECNEDNDIPESLIDDIAVKAEWRSGYLNITDIKMFYETSDKRHCFIDFMSGETVKVKETTEEIKNKLQYNNLYFFLQ